MTLSLPARSAKPRQRGITSMIEADPYRFPAQHVELLRERGVTRLTIHGSRITPSC